MGPKTKFEKVKVVVECLANDFNTEERKVILAMDYSQYFGLHGEELKSKLAKTPFPNLK
jgi:hypothetical protein